MVITKSQGRSSLTLSRFPFQDDTNNKVGAATTEHTLGLYFPAQGVSS